MPGVPGVMLVRADEHHRPFGFRDAFGELVPLVQPGRDTQLQDADELVHRAGRPGPAEDDQVIGRAANCVADDPPGVLAQLGGRQADVAALRGSMTAVGPSGTVPSRMTLRASVPWSPYPLTIPQ